MYCNGIEKMLKYKKIKDFSFFARIIGEKQKEAAIWITVQVATAVFWKAKKALLKKYSKPTATGLHSL